MLRMLPDGSTCKSSIYIYIYMRSSKYNVTKKGHLKKVIPQMCFDDFRRFLRSSGGLVGRIWIEIARGIVFSALEGLVPPVSIIFSHFWIWGITFPDDPFYGYPLFPYFWTPSYIHGNMYTEHEFPLVKISSGRGHGQKHIR